MIRPRRERRMPGCSSARVAASKLFCNGQGRIIGVGTVSVVSKALRGVVLPSEKSSAHSTFVLSIYPSDFRFGSKLGSADFERESSVGRSARIARCFPGRFRYERRLQYPG
jgi:hypothetical protein